MLVLMSWTLRGKCLLQEDARVYRNFMVRD